MADHPLISIVIPTYNRAKYILNTLNSVFAQTFSDFEVIVVDNASTDETVKLLEPLVRENKIRLIVHDRNYERAKSRNTGQLHARGTFLTFLDSDDFMYPSNLEDAAAFAKANPACPFFHNLYELIDENGKVLYRYPFKPIVNVHRQIAEGNFLSCIGVFIKRDIYAHVFWDETPVLVGSEDYDFWIRVLCKFPVLGRINKINSGILHHEGRTMNQLDLEAAIRRVDYLIQKIQGDQELYACYKPYLPAMKGSLQLFLCSVARQSHSRKGFSFLWKAFTNDPSLVGSRNFYSNIFLLLSGFFRKAS